MKEKERICKLSSSGLIRIIAVVSMLFQCGIFAARLFVDIRLDVFGWMIYCLMRLLQGVLEYERDNTEKKKEKISVWWLCFSLAFFVMEIILFIIQIKDAPAV